MAAQDATNEERAKRSAERVRALPAGEPPHRYSLPAPRTSFVGRSAELEQLAGLLAEPACRLLTIIGPGGIGKTRLAIEAAAAAQAAFLNGAAFASLQTVNSAGSLAPALADALGCVLRGQDDAREQVARYLSHLQLLLVLDNFEQLEEAAPWLSELLAAAPGLRLLVTSRVALNLEEEWRYPLAGLAVPGRQADEPARTEAVQLFVERARQVRPDFSLDAEREGVVRLCQITEGLPLALELAAAWVTTLPCQVIAEEIGRNVAFLSTARRDVPARHRSMQATFEHSWVLLSEDERQLFRRLAVFRGGFERDAAEQVAGALLPLLSSLVDKSLVRRRAEGRFHLHELLRQYAEEQLRADPEDAARTVAAHRDYYLAFVAERQAPITGGEQRAATLELVAELDNIRSAWRAAVAAGDVEALGRASHTLTVFAAFRGRYHSGLALLEDGLRVLRAAPLSPAVDRILAAMLVDTVRLHHPLGQLSAMRAALAEAEERYARLDIPPPPGQLTDPLWWRALLALIDGEYAEADRLGAAVVERSTAANRPGNLPSAWWMRATAALWQEQIDLASDYARQAAATALACGDRWELAYAANLRGDIAFARGEFATARRHYQDGYGIREEFGDPEGMAVGLSHLAKVAAQQHDWLEAERLYERSLAIARDIGDQALTVRALNGLGIVASAAGDYAAAAGRFTEGLQLMAAAPFMRMLLMVLTSAADWLLQTGQPREAVAPLAVALAHPASDNETRARARRLLEAAAAALPAEVDAAERERAEGADPVDLAALVMALLSAPAPELSAVAPRQPGGQAVLAEPLTARELAVLQLIAAGHTNREIADRLFLSVNTVASYSRQLYGKLGVGSRTQAVARARELGLLD